MDYPLGIVHEKRKEENVVTFDSDKLVSILDFPYLREMSECPSIIFGVRGKGEFSKCAICLPDCFDWSIVKDSYGKICLVPTRKE